MMYNCHSAARRAQFSIREGGIRGFEGREAKRKIMQRASSISRTASIKVGYLANGQDLTKTTTQSMWLTSP
jgi:hypothetical protein